MKVILFVDLTQNRFPTLSRWFLISSDRVPAQIEAAYVFVKLTHLLCFFSSLSLF